uniref:Uncharacterized protein n=1 Tax=Cyanoderma ruficeps TaxID=181631 RepID=A0A8C3R8U4_9PASS
MYRTARQKSSFSSHWFLWQLGPNKKTHYYHGEDHVTVLLRKGI